MTRYFTIPSAALIAVLCASALPAHASGHDFECFPPCEVEEERAVWTGGLDLDEDMREEGDWSLSLGVGFGLGPRTEGSDSTNVGVLPNVSLSYRDTIFLDPSGISAVVYRQESEEAFLNYAITASAGYDLGRDEDDDKGLLLGLGDVDASGILGLGADFEAGPVEGSLGVTQGIGGHEGTLIDLSVNLPIPIFFILENSFMAGSLGTTWASADYMQEYYSITDTQVRNSTLYNTPFSASAGIYKFNLGLFFGYEFSRKWALETGLDYTILLGDAEKSPIVKDNGDDSAVSFFMSASYRFNW